MAAQNAVKEIHGNQNHDQNVRSRLREYMIDKLRNHQNKKTKNQNSIPIFPTNIFSKF